MSNPGIHPLHRFRSHWPTKLWLGTLLAIAYCAGYFLIERHPLRPATRFALTIVDRIVPFQPKWIWVYQSLYLLLPAAWLCETRDQLRRYAIGFTLLTLAGFVCLVLWPVRGPRPLQVPANTMYCIVARYDTALNSFPSMHMALATFSACVAIKVTSGSLRFVLVIILPAWIVLIGYSTLATKQHYWVDLPPGILLGWAAQHLAWRHAAPRIEPQTKILVNEGAG